MDGYTLRALCYWAPLGVLAAHALPRLRPDKCQFTRYPSNGRSLGEDPQPQAGNRIILILGPLRFCCLEKRRSRRSLCGLIIEQQHRLHNLIAQACIGSSLLLSTVFFPVLYK